MNAYLLRDMVTNVNDTCLKPDEPVVEEDNDDDDDEDDDDKDEEDDEGKSLLK